MYVYDLIVYVHEQKVHKELFFKFIYNHKKLVQVPSVNSFAKKNIRWDIFVNLRVRDKIKFGLYERFCDACPIS